MREISSIEEALVLVDEWATAYRRLYASAVKECEELQDKLLMVEVDLTNESALRLLEKIEFQEEIAKLRKSIA